MVPNPIQVPGVLVASGVDIWYTTPKDKVKWARYIRCFIRDYGSYYGPVRAGVDYSRGFGESPQFPGLYVCGTYSNTIYLRFRKIRGREETRVRWWVVAPASDSQKVAILE